MKSLNEYRNFAMAHWGFNEREADTWAEKAIEAEEANQAMLMMQKGRQFQPRTTGWREAERERRDRLWDLHE